jgi:hypothetical protein
MENIVFKTIIRTSKKLAAVKLTKELTGWDLRTTKAFIDILCTGTTNVTNPSDEVIYLANKRSLPINFRDKDLEFYIRQFKSFGFECDNGRKDKLKKFIIEELRGDVLKSDEERLEIIESVSDTLIENFLESDSFNIIKNEITELEKNAFVNILVKKISNKLCI